MSLHVFPQLQRREEGLRAELARVDLRLLRVRTGSTENLVCQLKTFTSCRIGDI